MEECFPLLCPLMLCLKPEGLFSRVSSPALRSGWGLCVKIDLHSRRKKNICVKMWFCSIFTFEHFFLGGMLHFSFLSGETEANQHRERVLGLMLSPSDTLRISAWTPCALFPVPWQYRTDASAQRKS